MDSITCPNCGHENHEGDRFCSNCGARLTPISAPRDSGETIVSAAPSEPDSRETAPVNSTIPPPVTPSFARATNDWENQRTREPVDDDWKMSDLGPPPRRGRRVWLWVLLSLLGLILLCCIGGYAFFGLTDTGRELWEDAVATAEAISTEQAGN